MERTTNTGLVLAAVCAVWTVVGGLAGSVQMVGLALIIGVVALVLIVIGRGHAHLTEDSTENDDGTEEIPAWVNSPTGLNHFQPGWRIPHDTRPESMSEDLDAEAEKDWPNGRF